MVFKGIPAEPEQPAQEAVRPAAETERPQPPPAATGQSPYTYANSLASCLNSIDGNKGLKASW